MLLTLLLTAFAATPAADTCILPDVYAAALPLRHPNGQTHVTLEERDSGSGTLSVFAPDGVLRLRAEVSVGRGPDTVETFDPETYETWITVSGSDSFLHHGTYACYDSEGTITESGTRSSETYDDGGPTDTLRRYHPNGQLALEGTFRTGRWQQSDSMGTWTSYHPNGQLRTRWYIDRHRNRTGAQTAYDSVGQVVLRGHYEPYIVQDSVHIFDPVTYEARVELVDGERTRFVRDE